MSSWRSCAALGVPDRASRATPPTCCATERPAEAARRLEPVLVHRVGRRSVGRGHRCPTMSIPTTVWITLELEDGRRDTPTRLSAVLRRHGADGFGRPGGSSTRHAVDLDRIGKAPIPPGYHQLSLEGAGATRDGARRGRPELPAGRRGWGAFLPLYAVRTEDDWGVGSYTDLGRAGPVGRLARWVDCVGALPLYPAFLEPPADPSPYLPVSRLAYNEIYVDPTALPELAMAPPAQRLLDSDDFRRRLAAVHQAPLVDYEEVARLRRQVLEPMAGRCWAGGPEQPARRAAQDSRPSLRHIPNWSPMPASARSKATGWVNARTR